MRVERIGEKEENEWRERMVGLAMLDACTLGLRSVKCYYRC